MHNCLDILLFIIYLMIISLVSDRIIPLKLHFCFTERVRLAIDRRQVTPLILFDFSKAFDTVSHKLVLGKLRALNYSDRVVRWFASYLSGRSQAVRSDSSALSDLIHIFAGVSQGVLGPLLFAIFINDLPGVLMHTKHGICADDTRIYLHCHPSELAEHIHRLNEDASRVLEWAGSNLINLNPAKTQLIILGSQPNIAGIDLAALPAVVVGGVTIGYSSHVSDLVSDCHLR